LIFALLAGFFVLPPMRGAKAQTSSQDAPTQDAAAAPVGDQNQGLDDTLRAQIESLVREKESRTKAQAKIDSQLIYALKMERGEAITDAVPTLEVMVKVEEDGRTLVDIKADVTPQVLAAIKAAGGTVVNSFPNDKAIRASLPLGSLETIAGLAEVKFIRPADEAVTDKVDPNGKNAVSDAIVAPASGPTVGAAPAANSVNPTLLRGLRPGFADRAANVRARLTALVAGAAAQQNDPEPEIGAVTAESDTTERTREARNFYGLNGKGIKIGILSDSFNSRGEYANDIASGDLPGAGNPFGYTTPVTVVQDSGTSDEGRAMAQIIHDIVPGAQLFFATANGGEANFANNIRRLRNDFGCDIITDDVNYTLESPLHKSEEVSRAVDDVVASGAMYFASAGNAGNLNDGTSGVWEGNFNDAGANTGGIVTVVAGGTFHDFDPGAGVATQNPINRTITTARPATLFWSDPQGASTNDYDLYLISGTLDANGAGRVVAASTTIQNGTQDPVESVSVPGSANGAPGGRRIAVFKKTAAAVRFIHVNLNRSRFDPVNGAAIPAWETDGQSNGHDGTSDGYATAATPAVGPYPGVHTSANQVETFSSDGLRRVFYKYDNTPFTPGDLLATGGTVLQKPQITAADGVQTTVPGFQPFFGTSAAAPTAAAIAGLVKASNASLTRTQILNALTSTAIDIEAAGTDRDSGVGIIMAYQALQSLSTPPGATVEAGTPTVTATSGCDTALNPGETGSVTVPLNNLGGGTATNVSATLTSTTPGVTVTNNYSAYPNIPAGGSASNSQPFTFRLSGDMACGQTINFSLRITFSGGQASPVNFPFTVQLAGTPSATPSTYSYSGSPVTIPDNNATGVNIPVTVSGFTGAISDLNFRFGGSSCNAADAATTNGVNHVFVGDLIFKLTSPSGKTVTIISQAGGASNSGNHFCNTVLDDDTANGSIQSVASGTNLNTGTFKPANPLSAFDGENPNGTWTLNASDVGATDVGNVTAFALDIAGYTCPAAPTSTITGRVTDGGGNGINAVTVTLTGDESQSTTTNANGDYSFTLATCGLSYTVTPTKPGYTFSPPNRTYIHAGSAITGADFTGTNSVTPSTATPGQVLISEFRARGLAGAFDEFVEIYNNTNSPITVGSGDGSTAGWLLAALDSSGTSSTPIYIIPNGTVIPARGHYLMANSRGYSLDGYAQADAYFTPDIPDNTGLALFSTGTTSGTVFDAAGFNTAPPGFADTYREGGGMTPVGTNNGQYTFYRKMVTLYPQDTNNNQNDFDFVSTDLGVYGGRPQKLGAPGPENRNSPIPNGAIQWANVAPCASPNVAPNRVRINNGTQNTIEFRKTITNTSTTTVTRLRFRLVDVTAGPTAPGSGIADIRATSSTATTESNPCGGGNITIEGLRLEEPPNQPLGGGYNSTLSADTITLSPGLPGGASVNVNFKFNVLQGGYLKFYVLFETLP
jgi:subtilisin-like proprotein convertase family protein